MSAKRMYSSDDLELLVRDIPDFPCPGILFRDITPILANSDALAAVIRLLAEQVRGLNESIDFVAAAEARGFLFASPLAIELGAGLIPIRKPGKLPWKTISYSYELEYGRNELNIHADAVPLGARVLLLDDLLATGGTMNACVKLIEQAGGSVVACAFVIELTDLGGREKLDGNRILSLIRY